MKRRILLVGAISAGFYTLVATSALAVFLPQARLSYFTLRTGTVDLLATTDPSPTIHNYVHDSQFPDIPELFPGEVAITFPLSLKNDSGEGKNIQPVAQFVPTPSEDWDALKHIIEISVADEMGQGSTGFLSLDTWSQQESAFPGPRLQPKAEFAYTVSVKMAEMYPVDPDGSGPLQAGQMVGPEVMDKQLVDGTFLIKGYWN